MTSGPGILPEHCKMYLALPGPIEFHQEDALPRAQPQLPAGEWDKQGMADQRRFDVGVGITFCMLVRVVPRHKPVQAIHDVTDYRRVCIFIDQKTARRMRCEEIKECPFHVLDGPGHILCDTLPLNSGVGSDLDFHHALILLHRYPAYQVLEK